MPPTKKKAKKLAVSSSNAEPSSSGSADPAPVQKKRGRPRKIVKEESEADYKTGLSLLGASTAEQQEALLKRAKLKSETGGAAEMENGKILAAAAAASAGEPLLKKPPGRRRKSEPHRAPGVLIEGFL